MSVFLSKLLPLFVYPVGLAAILVLFSIIFWKKKKAALVLIIVALSVVWIGGNRWVAMSLAKSLEWKYLPPANLQKVAAVVVLGGGTEPAEKPRMGVELNGAGDRVLAGYRLYKSGVTTHLLLSGGDIDFLDTSSSSPAEDMAVLLKEFGVPDDAIWLDTTSQNTYENAINCAKILKEKGINRIALVTSAAHMPRSVKLFEKQGLEVIPYPVDYTVTEAGWQQLWHGDFGSVILNLFPNASSLNMTTNVLKEYFGMLYYSILK
jgi:uncharacterized SAM-binding protein YcdF (DUF218 family)